MDDVQASRWLNARLYGNPEETYCSRLWRWRWLPWCAAIILWIDREAIVRHGEAPGHCRRAHEAHRAGQGGKALELPGLLRRDGLL